MATNQAFEDRARTMAARCERLGLAFSREARNVERVDTWLRMTNIFVGAIATLVTISQPIASWLGQNTARTISIIAAIILIFDGLIPYFRGRVSSDRFRDFAFYIHSYNGLLMNTLSDGSLTDAQRRAKVFAILHLAELNLSDVCSKFPAIYNSAITSFESSSESAPARI